jgi:hypothetical protein
MDPHRITNPCQHARSTQVRLVSAIPTNNPTSVVGFSLLVISAGILTFKLRSMLPNSYPTVTFRS